MSYHIIQLYAQIHSLTARSSTSPESFKTRYFLVNATIPGSFQSSVPHSELPTRHFLPDSLAPGKALSLCRTPSSKSPKSETRRFHAADCFMVELSLCQNNKKPQCFHIVVFYFDLNSKLAQPLSGRRTPHTWFAAPSRVWRGARLVVAPTAQGLSFISSSV